MPELPDVEAVRRYLMAQGLVDRAIEGVELLWPRAVRAPSQEEFGEQISGRRVGGVRRRAKYLVLDLSGHPGRKLILHLRMTGSLRLVRSGMERPPHTRNVLLLDGGDELCFVDPRKLGAIWLVGDEEEVLAGLGPEPLDPAFTPEVLAQRLSGRSAPIKALLCDQAVVAGIGNIYADEVLFVARMHPLTPGRLTSSRKARQLHQAIVTRLTEAVEQLAPLVPGGGPPTESGEGKELLLVPRSEGAPCARCGAPIRRIPVRGRSSYFCPRCQRRRG